MNVPSRRQGLVYLGEESGAYPTRYFWDDARNRLYRDTNDGMGYITSYVTEDMLPPHILSVYQAAQKMAYIPPYQENA